MCLKEAVTNVVKHSQATHCHITIKQSWNEISVTVHDNGIGIIEDNDFAKGNGLLGMQERLEFVNGSLEITVNEGTNVIMKVPHIIKQTDEEGLD